MFLASSRPHNDFPIKVMRGRIEVGAVDLPCHRRVSGETTVDAVIAVTRGRVLRIVIYVVLRL